MLRFDFDETGIFIGEIKNRFRALVDINGTEEICYIQSSSRLSNYVFLNKKIVYLKRINIPNKLVFKVYAKKIKRDFMLLCPSISNNIILSEINKRRFSWLRKRSKIYSEHMIENYKCDIYIEDTKTIIEVKSFLSEKENVFPSVYSERTNQQIDVLNKLQKNGYNIVYFIISLNPYIEKIDINPNTEFNQKMKKLISSGATLKAYSVSCLNNLISIKKEIKVNM